MALLLAASLLPAQAQIVSFSFSATSVSTSGWVNVAGDPSTALLTATANGITVNSVSTLNWSPLSGSCAQNARGVPSGSYLPSTVMANNWFNYNGSARSLALLNFHVPQIELTGLNPDSTYSVRICGSDTSSLVTNPTQYTLAGPINYGTRTLNAHNNATNGVIFANVSPDASGFIRIYVNATTSTDLAPICGIQVYPGSYQVPSPTVAISTPPNGQPVAEGDNVTIEAAASETGGTISKVEFYADTTKIGEVDATPYNFTWVDPDPGIYTITVKATDNSGTVGSVDVGIAVHPLNYFWSLTGNAGNNADSNYLGNVDSVRLDFRTRNIQRMSIAPGGNIGIGTISPSAQLHTTGSARLAGLASDTLYNRLLVADAGGNLAYRSVGPVGQSVDNGLSVTGSDSVSIGDSIAGPTSRSFISNRFQHFNGHFYSIGGSVDSPVNLPVFRWYDNGDLVSGTTMTRSVNTQALNGLRYYNKMGTLELGASDRLDTLRNKVVSGSWQGSGMVINSDDSNSGGPKMINSIYLSDVTHTDTAVTMVNSLLALELSTINNPASLTNSLFSGYGQFLNSQVSNSFVVGQGHSITHPANGIFVGCYTNTQEDTAKYSLAVGSDNQFGGLGQLVGGQFLKNRTPFGAAVGNGNVDFTSLSYTGTRGVTVSGIAGYPLLAIGNSSAAGTISSNAVTVLYNGRTQINTTGYTSGLSQSAVTPKAALEVASTNSGVLFPLLTTAQRNAIITPDLQTGLLLYNTDAGSLQFYNGTTWKPVGVGGVFSNEWDSSGNATTNPSSNFVGTTDTERLVLRTENIARMTILQSGAVGIGTSAPQTGSLLSVAGTVYAKKVEATLTGWPDYVFNPGYSLMTLLSLRHYIREHQRLPGIVSSRDAAEKGVDLGENQAALLRKIEELTLYLIEGEKQTVRRQREIAQLTQANKVLSDYQQEIDKLREQLQKLVEKK